MKLSVFIVPVNIYDSITVLNIFKEKEICIVISLFLKIYKKFEREIKFHIFEI